MKKIKTIFLCLLLCLPFWATAQWSVNTYAGGGYAMETANQEKQVTYFRVKNSKTTTDYPGYTFQGGINIQYMINQKFGFGTGLGYQYEYSGLITLPEEDAPFRGSHWHSESLKIPFDFLWSPGKRHHSVFNIGLATHINLMSYGTFWGVYNDQYPVFTSAQLGYSHRLGKRFHAGILLETDLGWYARTTAYASEQPPTTVFANRSFTSAQLIFSYRLFGKDGKK